MPQIVPTFADRPSAIYNVKLGEDVYRVRFTWRVRQARWYIDLYDSSDNALIEGKMLSPGASPWFGTAESLRPAGLLLCEGPDDYVQADLGVALKVSLASETEMATIVGSASTTSLSGVLADNTIEEPILDSADYANFVADTVIPDSVFHVIAGDNVVVTTNPIVDSWGSADAGAPLTADPSPGSDMTFGDYAIPYVEFAGVATSLKTVSSVTFADMWTLAVAFTVTDPAASGRLISMVGDNLNVTLDGTGGVVINFGGVPFVTLTGVEPDDVHVLVVACDGNTPLTTYWWNQEDNDGLTVLDGGSYAATSARVGLDHTTTNALTNARIFAVGFWDQLLTTKQVRYLQDVYGQLFGGPAPWRS